MKYLFIGALVSISAILSKNVHAQSWMWGKNSSGTYGQTTNHHATDAQGNSYQIGYTQKTPSDPANIVQIGTNTLTGTEGGYCFLAKYNVLGAPLWMHKIGLGTRCATDPSGNVFIATRFSGGHFTLGAYTVYAQDSTYSSSNTLAIAKLDSAGNVLWLRSAGAMGPNSYEVNAIATDPSGNVVVTGVFDNKINFGSTTLTNSPSSYAGQVDCYVAKYSASGTIMWAKSIGGNVQDWSYGIATDPAGNVIVTGNFTSDTVTASGVSLLNPSNGYQMFLVKYGPTGTLAWAKAATGTGTDQITDMIDGKGVATDGAGNIYIVGRTNLYSSNIGGLTVSNPSGWQQYLLAKYGADGVCKWARVTDFTDVCGGTLALAITVYGPYVYSIGATGAHSTHYLDTVSVNPGYFILKSDTSGHFIKNISLSNPQITPIAIDHDAQGNIYVSGGMNANCSVGPDNLTASGAVNSLMAKYGLPVNRTPELMTQQLAHVYPNPSIGIVYVTIPAVHIQASIMVTDVAGRLVSQAHIAGNTGVPRQFNLQPGIYFIKITADEASYTSKVVVE